MKQLLLLSCLALVACDVPRDDRPAVVKAAAANGVPVTSGEAATDRARAEYLSRVVISKVTSRHGTGAFDKAIAIVNGEVKNTGDQSLDDVAVTIYFLDMAGKAIHEDTYHPVLVGGFTSQTPLRANYGVKWGGGFSNVPDDWSGAVSVKVTDVKFSLLASK